MISKAGEKMFYQTIYILAFGVEAQFFYSNDSRVIFLFLKERFWGEDLKLRTKLLSKLLYFDSVPNAHLKRDLRVKSKELLRFITLHQE